MSITDRSVCSLWRTVFIKKGRLTREMIVEKAAALFNCRGYFGASMSDLMAATGLEKGGIYNHFASKDELAMAAFEYAVRVNGALVMESVNQHQHSIDKLEAFVACFSTMSEKSPVPGGCPLLNTAIECDDSHPEMRERVQSAVKLVLRSLENIIKSGIKCGEIRDDVDAKAEARVIFSALEGSIMLSRLLHDSSINAISAHLQAHIRSLRA